jgi:hypothetical protein
MGMVGKYDKTKPSGRDVQIQLQSASEEVPAKSLRLAVTNRIHLRPPLAL